jgi:hypothetical protein
LELPLSDIFLSSQLREQALMAWLIETFSVEKVQLIPLPGDAGFRRYFRFFIDNQQYIAVDAPNEYCNNEGFLAIQQAFERAKVRVPQVLAVDLSLGYFCLEDLGERSLSQLLTDKTVEHYYRQALTVLLDIASIQPQAINQNAYQLPRFDSKFIATELEIFSQWLLKQHCQLLLTTDEEQQLTHCFVWLAEQIQQQPYGLMHRDYHSRNIMQIADQLAVIDFQDAVVGPLSYDAVSLLRDCYVRWPQQLVSQLAEYYRQQLNQRLGLAISSTQWHVWFDVTGIQRHLKAAGIFARLHYRDGKSHYLKDIPLTLEYIVDIAQQYQALHPLVELITQKVQPVIQQLTPALLTRNVP